MTTTTTTATTATTTTTTMRTIDGKPAGAGLKIAIVASRFNAFIVDRLVDGAVGALGRAGASLEDVTVVRCPGAFELAPTARRVLDAGAVDAIVCLGCVIRGATPHFDYVAGEAARGLGEVAMNGRVPVVFGVLTTDTVEQAIERAGESGNKGADAALAALEMASVFAQLGAPAPAGSR
jgi:6,7-dimethyl-8-ribityllumazine synthase